MDQPEQELARSLLAALREDFAEREPTATQLAGLLLDAVAAAIPLTRHEPAAGPLSELETLAQQVDLFSWDGAPGWDVVLRAGLHARQRLQPGISVLDGLGARPDRTQQRGELKRRAHAEAERLVLLGREAARFSAGAGESAQVLDQMPTLPPSAALVAAHAALLRLVGWAMTAPLLSLPEQPQPGPLPPPALDALLRDLDERGENFAFAQDEWLARLLAENPAVAAVPAFRTFYAGLSQSLRAAASLREFREAALGGALAADAEALLGAVASWQPARWPTLRAGAPPDWISALCPVAPPEEPLPRLAGECTEALAIFSRLWFARDLSPGGFTALAALFAARCASAVALWEELGGGAAPR